MKKTHVLTGDCRDRMREMADHSIDAVVTDPPYGLSKEPDIAEVMQHWIAGDDYQHGSGGFMGKGWDSFVPGPSYWKEVLRVLKPGGHVIAFGGTRTYDLLVIALRFAGFEIRDQLQWMYGCLSDDTEILVDGDWVHYLKATEGRLALCYDANENTYSWQPIEHLFVYDYEDTAYHIFSDQTDQIVSRNHRCLVEREGTLVFEIAEEVAQERQARVPILEGLSDLLSSLPLPDKGVIDRQEKSVGEGHTTTDLAGIEPVSYVGKVWCVKVPTGAFVARRNGKVFVTGNSGFPKSLSVGKAIDKTRGSHVSHAERLAFAKEVREKRDVSGVSRSTLGSWFPQHKEVTKNWERTDKGFRFPSPVDFSVLRERLGMSERWASVIVEDQRAVVGEGGVDRRGDETVLGLAHNGNEYASTTDAAKTWDGWGTSLKPAHEPIVLARKPLIGTVAANVLEHGTGGLNIDASRVGIFVNTTPSGFDRYNAKMQEHGYRPSAYEQGIDAAAANVKQGRWPANVLLSHHDECRQTDGVVTVKGDTRCADHSDRKSGFYTPGMRTDKDTKPRGVLHGDEERAVWDCHTECPIKVLDEQSGVLTSGKPGTRRKDHTTNSMAGTLGTLDKESGFGDTGGASRFFMTFSNEETSCGDGSTGGVSTSAGKKMGNIKDNLPTDGRGSKPTEVSQTDTRSTISTTIPLTTASQTSSVSRRSGMTTITNASERTTNTSKVLSTDDANDAVSTEISISSTKGKAGPTKVIADPAHRHTSEIGETKTASTTTHTIASTDGRGTPKPRFFYCAKTAKKEKQAGCGDLYWKRKSKTKWEPATKAEWEALDDKERRQGNTHPTVKPISLMRYLVRLVTPPGGTVLDPFMGSGSTGLAALEEGFDFVGIELEEPSAEIAKARINASGIGIAEPLVEPTVKKKPRKTKKKETTVQGCALPWSKKSK